MTDDGRVSTGVPGWDEILNGGLRPHQNALVRGPPGAGKTTFGLHFLSEGTEADETALFINLGEPEEYVRRTAEHYGMSHEAIQFLDLAPTDEQFTGDETYTLFSSAEVEQPSFVREIRQTVDDLSPDRVLLDPITEFRYLAPDDHQFRTQILSFLDYLRSNRCTVLLTSQASPTIPDDDLQFLTDVVVNLENAEELRTVHVSKLRRSSYRRGRHAYEITDDGIVVFPKLAPAPADAETAMETLSSGVPELDAMLHGGLETGTITFLSGPTGAGKTTTGVQFLHEAARDDRHCVLYSFEESAKTLLRRTASINIPLGEMIDRGAMELVEVLPLELTLDEFCAGLREAVEGDDAEIVMIDGISGFKQGLRGLSEDPARDLITIGRYLRVKGVTAIFTSEVHQITGQFRATEEQTSNVADSVVFFRHVEYKGEMRKVIGVLKKRTSDFQSELRRLEITEDGVQVGEPLPQLRGILTGTPEWSDGASRAPGDR